MKTIPEHDEHALFDAKPTSRFVIVGGYIPVAIISEHDTFLAAETALDGITVRCRIYERSNGVWVCRLAASAKGSVKKTKQIFVMTPGSVGTWWHAGGQDLDQAMQGIMNLIKPDVAELLSNTGDAFCVDIAVREMTDQEVDELPEVP